MEEILEKGYIAHFIIASYSERKHQGGFYSPPIYFLIIIFWLSLPNFKSYAHPESGPRWLFEYNFLVLVVFELRNCRQYPFGVFHP